MCVAVYHCKCIDTWLVEDSDLCPLCKKSVIDDDDGEDSEAAAGATGSTDASAAAAAATAAATSINNEETEDAPLLHGAAGRRPRRYGSRFRGSSTL